MINNVFGMASLLCNKAEQCYRKIPIIILELTFVQKAFSSGPIFARAYFPKGLLLDGILRFKIVWP